MNKDYLDSGLLWAATKEDYCLNRNKASSIFYKGIEKNDPKCKYGLARLIVGAEQQPLDYYTPPEIDRLEIYKEILPTIKKWAENGDGEALSILGEYNEIGICAEANKDKAKEYYIAGANTKCLYSILKLGSFYSRNGQLTEAFECFKNGAKRDSFFNYAMGTFDVDRRLYERANNNYMIAARDGNNAAMFQLGNTIMLSKNPSLENVKQAYEYCKKAEEAGNEYAPLMIRKLSDTIDAIENPWGFALKSDLFSPVQRSIIENGLKGLETANKINLANELLGKNDVTDLKEAVKLFKEVISENPVYKNIYSPNMLTACVKLYKILDENNDGEAITWLNEAISWGDKEAYFVLGQHYYSGDITAQDYSKAIYAFQKSIYNGVEEGLSYFYIANCFAFGLGMPKKIDIAKDNYINALKYGFNCQYAIESLYRNNAMTATKSGMQEYAENILTFGITNMMEINVRIENDLKNDFGKTWDMLQESAKQSLITGIFAFIMLYSAGENSYKNKDFSIVITPFTKALEIVLSNVFYTQYIRYLKRNNVEVAQVKGIKNFMINNKDNQNYPDENNLNLFSLGGLRHIFDVYSLKNYVENAGIPCHILSYANELFYDEAFPKENRLKEIAKYLIDFSDEILTIKEYRNPASHGRIMTCADAEVCGDCIVKVKKILYELLIKIKQPLN